MKTGYLILISGLLLLCLLIVPTTAASSYDERLDDLGQRAAEVAMDKLGFEYGDPDVVVLTDAGRVLVGGGTTQSVIAGITEISGLQNCDETLYQINSAEWNDLWIFFYDRNTGMGLYLKPDESFFTMNDAEADSIPAEDAFSTVTLATCDIYQMIDDTEVGNATNAAVPSSAIRLCNAWAYGAPYDLMYAASLHNHVCPGLVGGYLAVKFVEEELPPEDGTSYTVVYTSPKCKLDVYPTLWDMTPGKGSVPIVSTGFTEEDQETFTEKYGGTPTGIFVRWNSREKSGDGIVIKKDSSTSDYNGPDWGTKTYSVAETMKDLENEINSFTVMKEFTVDSDMLSELKNPENNPYEVIGMI